MKGAPNMLKWIKENTISIEAAAKLSLEERANKFITGKFVDENKADYSTKYQNIIDNCMKKAAKGGVNHEK